MTRVMWACEDCDFAVLGDEHAAAAHHDEEGCFSHWLYEFRENTNGMMHVPTGRNIHSSDWGGFYLDDAPIMGELSVEEIFLHNDMNRRVHALAQHTP